MFASPRLEKAGQPIELGLRKAMAMLSYLVLTKGEYSRDELASLFWPESSPSSARANLRRCLYRINKSIGQEIIPSGKEIIGLDPDIEIWTDVGMFKQRLEACLPKGELQEEINPNCITTLEEAVDLYQGDLLAGFSLPDCRSYDEWLFFETENLRASLVNALRQLSTIYQSQGQYERAIQHARHWLSLDLLHEPAHRLLMDLYAQTGQQAAALRQYQECERILEQELHISPQPETTALYEDIRLSRTVERHTPIRKHLEIRYVLSGDVHIAYQVFGEGAVDIVWVGGFIYNQEQMWEQPSLAAFFEELSSFSRTIIFDRRGTGLSDRVGYSPTLDDTMDDVQAVMRAAGSKHPVLFGYLEGGPTNLLFTATYPERVSGLILYGTCAKWTYSEDYPWALTRQQYDRWLTMISENWGAALNLETYAPSRALDPELQSWWARFMRMSSSPGGIKAVLEVMRDIDVRNILPAIRTPTLVLHRKGDRAIRIGAARYLAGQIPGAKYVELEGQDHWFFIGDRQAILREIEDFIHNLASPAVPERMLATILIIELLDDATAEGRETPTRLQIEPTYAYFKQEVARFHGSEVTRSQGRYTATFGSPSRAIHCAKTVMEGARQRYIDLRISLHTGECEFVAGELGGNAIKIAKGVLNAAGVNEILTSSTVKDLVVGSGFCFSERGKHAFEGVSGDWRIYAVD
ncbi:MAG: alpha/beta fold hydrolase [Anaerolineales bacterium]